MPLPPPPFSNTHLTALSYFQTRVCKIFSSIARKNINFHLQFEHLGGGGWETLSKKNALHGTRTSPARLDQWVEPTHQTIEPGSKSQLGRYGTPSLQNISCNACNIMRAFKNHHCVKYQVHGTNTKIERKVQCVKGRKRILN